MLYIVGQLGSAVKLRAKKLSQRQGSRMSWAISTELHAACTLLDAAA